jgi:hypothetical protein
MTSSDGVSKRSSVMQPLGGLKAPDTEGKMKSKQSLHSTTEPKRSKTKLIGSMNELSKSVDSGNMGRVSWYAPFTHWIYELTNYLQEKYYEYVSYRAECILELFLLIPFGLLGLILYYMDSAILPNAIVEVLLKVSLVVAGQIAEYSASIINKRHSQMKLMAKIAANRATARDVFNTLRGKNINRVLKYSGMII